MEGSEPPLHPRLSHLSADEVAELIERYYAGERVADLQKAFNLKGTPSGFVHLLPPIVHHDLTCAHCQQHMQSKRNSRDSWRKSEPACPACGHKNITHCSCVGCREASSAKAMLIETRKRDTLRRRFSHYRSPELDLDSITFREAVFLLAIYRHCVSEDLATAAPYGNFREKLSPTDDARKEILDELAGSRFIAISPTSKSEAFIFNEDFSDCPKYYPAKVDWLFMPGIDPELKKEFVAELEHIARDGPWPDHWRYATFEFWHTIAKAECFQYYQMLLEQRSYEAEFGPKTHAVFENLLESFSIGQAFNLTWQAVRDTSDHIAKTRPPKSHAKNFFIGAVQRKADKHRAEGWIPSHGRRDFNCPQTVVSSVYFDLFTGVGVKALETLPRLDWGKRYVGDAEISA